MRQRLAWPLEAFARVIGGNNNGSGNQGYDGTQTTNRRRGRSHLTASTDYLLGDKFGRQWAASEVRDLTRNFSLAAWAVRMHLNYVTGFTFHSESERVEQLMAWWSQPLNCDVRGLHDLQAIIRMSEERRTCDGDILLLKLSNGMLQPIEGDRIQTPPAKTGGAMDTQRWVNGVRLSKGGRAQAYGIFDRSGNSYQYDRTVRAGNAFVLGYYQRFDQVRGVSPLLSASNHFRDLYESAEYELAKGKVLASMGLVIKSPDAPQLDAEEFGKAVQKHLGRAPVVSEIGPEDEVDLLTADTPSNQWQDFAVEVARGALSSIDIPYSFYNGKGHNFSQMKADHNNYLKSVEQKRRGPRTLLENITKWQLSRWFDGGLITEDEAFAPWQWFPSGVPWWNPVDEIDAALMEQNAGLGSPQEYVATFKGRRWIDVQRDNQAAQETRTEMGLPNLVLRKFQPAVAEVEPEPDDSEPEAADVDQDNADEEE